MEKKGGFNIYKKLENRSKQLNKLIKETKHKLNGLPEGKLVCCGENYYKSDGHNFLKEKR